MAIITGQQIGTFESKAPEGTDKVLLHTNSGESLTSVDDLKDYSISNLFANIYMQVKTGKDLGTGLTSQQISKIAAGDFYGLNIGDYWHDSNHKYRIWHPNWYLRRGSTEFTKPHLVIMTDDNVLDSDGSTTHYMNATDTTDGGYDGTVYRATYKAQAKAVFTKFFGTDHVATYKGLISNGTKDGAASAWYWTDCDCELPTEEMMYGSHHWSTSKDSGSSGYNGGSFWGQLALAQVAPEFVINRENYWLQDVCSASGFALVLSHGYADRRGASNAGVGVRPFILLI